MVRGALRRGSLRTALAFVVGREAPDYGALLSRLRWRRAVSADSAAEILPRAPAAAVFSAADLWVVVLETAAVPVGVAGFPLVPPGGALRSAAASVSAESGAAAHTLRELEALPALAKTDGGSPSALAFRAGDFAVGDGETVDVFLRRVAAVSILAPGGSFAALAPDDPSQRERPELSRRIPAGCRRLADIGCGAGATAAAVARREPGLAVTGIEKNEVAAARARERLARVLVGEAGDVLRGLAAAGERFDAFLLGDVLEHASDPVALLGAARAAADLGARLVASVPNAGHLSLVRDLILGRFDPVPAGLADAGHLRWFTRPFLIEALEEAGWHVESVDGIPSAPPPATDAFLRSISGFSGLDPAALLVYQWIAVARAD